MRAYRKDIADLLKAGKLDYAIIRVESVIREQLTLTGVFGGGGGRRKKERRVGCVVRLVFGFVLTGSVQVCVCGGGG